MSISSHLTPEPERRLWIIHENMRRAANQADLKIGAMTAFAAVQLALVKFLLPAGPMTRLSMILLAAVLPLGIFALSSFSEEGRDIPIIKPPKEKKHDDDLLTSVVDVAKYPHSELVLRLDSYLGGGITSTQYHEDIVGLIAFSARVAVRKRRFFEIMCIITGIAQLFLLVRLIMMY